MGSCLEGLALLLAGLFGDTSDSTARSVILTTAVVGAVALPVVVFAFCVPTTREHGRIGRWVSSLVVAVASLLMTIPWAVAWFLALGLLTLPFR